MALADQCPCDQEESGSSEHPVADWAGGAKDDDNVNRLHTQKMATQASDESSSTIATVTASQTPEETEGGGDGGSQGDLEEAETNGEQMVRQQSCNSDGYMSVGSFVSGAGSSFYSSAASNLDSRSLADLDIPRLPRTDTSSSLASSCVSESEPPTPTSLQTFQDKWTPQPQQDGPRSTSFDIPASGSTSIPEPEPVARISTRRVSLSFALEMKQDDFLKQELDDMKQIDAYAETVAKQAIQNLMPSELVSLISGKDMWHTCGVPRLGIPSIRMTDGPFGARGPGTQGPCSALAPCGIALGATWNEKLLIEVGTLLGEEARLKGADILLGPTVNLVRIPIAGRTFECMAEDPYLTAQLAVAYIHGVQSVEGVGACVKHFAVNDQEKNRMFCNAEVSPTTLRGLHLQPFEAAVKQGHVMAVMTAYNKLNGSYCSEQSWLLADVLRRDWGFKGLVMSDWGGTHSTENCLKAGLDIEMPGTDSMHYGEKLKKRLAEGKVMVADVRQRASAVLRVMARLGLVTAKAFSGPSSMLKMATPKSATPKSAETLAGSTPTASPASTTRRVSAPPTVQQTRAVGGEPPRPKPSPNTREQQELLCRAAAEAMVLLKNEGVLPIDRQSKIAVIGPNATALSTMGGGSCGVLPNRSERSLVNQLRARNANVVAYEQGCDSSTFLPVLVAPVLRSKDGRGLLKGEFFEEPKDSNSAVNRKKVPVMRTTIQYTDFGVFSGIYYNQPPGKLSENKPWSARFEGQITPEVTGTHELGLFASGTCEIFLDGVSIFKVPQAGIRSLPMMPPSLLPTEIRITRELQADQKYDLVIVWASLKDGPYWPAQCHLGFRPKPWRTEEDLTQAAVDAAREADVAVVVVGTDSWHETEGRDQASMALPGRSAELCKLVSKANQRTIVCLNCGSPKELHPWIDDVPGVVAVWFGGQEVAAALADVLLGEGVGPCGRLPVTWPKVLSEGPTESIPNERYPGECGKVSYSEGQLIGYRWYDAKDIQPSFPFGHGLSYTTFEYIDLCLPNGDKYAPGKPVDAVVTLENVGERSGVEVIQLYVAGPLQPNDKAPSKSEIRKALAAFAKVPLDAGETVDVKLQVSAKAMQPATAAGREKAKAAGAADFEIIVGSSSQAIFFRKRITVA